jgi:serine-type D-Ala-D-Ala carboxypeptidase (penicillin-binding protein 5/6)
MRGRDGMRNAKDTILLVGLLLVTTAVSPVRAASTRCRNVITAKSAILIDDQTSEVLWQHNPDLPLPPASTTKIVTAMLALQSGRLEDSLSVTPEAAQAPPSKISLRPGWKMRLRDLVYAVLLNSANDAAVVIAEGLSGSVRSFADRMNVQARAMGATNTHFVNPNGLPADNHYSTARDLATMFSYGMRNPLFEHIVNTKTTEVSPSFGTRRLIKLHNHNRLLGNYRIHVVGKTGWTIAAKKCFVGAAEADGRQVVVAVMGSRDLWGDLKRLLEFGFDGGVRPLPEAVELDTWTAAAPASAGGDDADDAPAAVRAQQKYAVHLATFRRKSTATHLQGTMARSGYPARVETIHGRGRLALYRVAVGDYSNRQDAERAADRIKKTHRDLKTSVVQTS